MKPDFSNEQFAVFDGFLKPSDFKKFQSLFKTDEFRPVSQFYRKGKSVKDVGVLVGSAYHVYEDDFGTNAKKPSALMVNFLNVLGGRLKDFVPWVGRFGEDYFSYSARSNIYPIGASAGWHTDVNVLGAFIFYAHPVWFDTWGGELLVSTQTKYKMPRTKEMNDILKQGAGLSYAIHPRPNRLVVLKGGSAHCVRTVEPNPKSASRLSIAGFFHTHDEEVELLKKSK